MPPLPVGVITDQGSQRSNNEDLPFVDAELGLYVVVDGLGGELAGEKASQTAVEMIRSRFADPEGDTEERIREAITLANNEIHRLSEQNAEWRGMACVLTMAVVEGRTVTIGHVGDSRLYRIRGGEIKKITPDHSPVGEREDRNEITEVEAMRHPRRNEVYRDVGSDVHQSHDPEFIEIVPTSLPPDAALLLCSDGLSDMITSHEMMRVINTYDGDPTRVARDLVAAANDAGGKDNITVIFLPGPSFRGAYPAKGEEDHRSTRRMTSVAIEHADLSATQELPAVAVETLPALETLPDEILETPEPPRTGKYVLAWSLVIVFAILAGSAFYLWRSFYPEPAPPAGPQTLKVGMGAQFETIETALAAAHPGDRIEVSPGTYRGPIRLKSGVVLSTPQAGGAVIEAAEIGDAPVFDALQVKQARLEGFRIVAPAAGVLRTGIRLDASSLELANVEISGAASAGVDAINSSNLQMTSVTIHNGNGCGLRLTSSRGVVRGSEIGNNALAGIEVLGTSSLDLDTNEICRNGRDLIGVYFRDRIELFRRTNTFGKACPVGPTVPPNRPPSPQTGRTR